MTDKELAALVALLIERAENLNDPEAYHSDIADVMLKAADALVELRVKNAALKGALISGLRYSAGVTKIFSERFPDEELDGTDVQKYYDEFLPLAQAALEDKGNTHDLLFK